MLPLGMVLFGPLADIVSIDILLVMTGLLMTILYILLISVKKLRNIRKNMINGINHIKNKIKNIDTAYMFYKNILKLKPIMKSDISAYFLAGKIWIALDQKEQYIASTNYSHICFYISKRQYRKFAEK
jgi:hypothetical protein